MTAEMFAVPARDPLPEHLGNRIVGMIHQLHFESQTIQVLWDGLDYSARMETLKQIKRLSNDLYNLSLNLTKGGNR